MTNDCIRSISNDFELFSITLSLVEDHGVSGILVAVDFLQDLQDLGFNLCLFGCADFLGHQALIDGNFISWKVMKVAVDLITNLNSN